MRATPPGFSIGAAPPAGTRVSLALLPELESCEVLPSRCWWVLPDAGPVLPLGAAALLPNRYGDAQPGFQFLLRVLPTQRRKGLGAVLLGALVTEARAWGIEHLYTKGTAASTEAAAFLQAQGFQPCLAVHHFVGEMAAALPQSTQRVASLQARGRIPADLQVRPLHEAPLAVVAALYRSHLGGPQAWAERHIAQLLEDPATRHFSVAVWQGERLAGFLLTKLNAGLAEADLWFSDPSDRQGLVGMLALDACLKQIASWGGSQFRFHCNEETRATLNFARRIGARLIHTQLSYRLDLEPGTP